MDMVVITEPSVSQEPFALHHGDLTRTRDSFMCCPEFSCFGFEKERFEGRLLYVTLPNLVCGNLIFFSAYEKTSYRFEVEICSPQTKFLSCSSPCDYRLKSVQIPGMDSLSDQPH